MPCRSCFCNACSLYYFKFQLKKDKKKYCPICNKIKNIYDFQFKYPNTTDKRRRHHCYDCTYYYNSSQYKKRNNNI